MRLAHKLSLAQVILIMALLVVYASLQYRRENRLFESFMRRDQHQAAKELAAALEEVWAAGRGQDSVDRLLREAERAETDIDVSWIPSGQGLPPEVVQGPQGATVVSGLFPDPTEGSRYSTYVPVKPQGEFVGFVKVSESLAGERRFARASLLRITLTALAVGLGAAAVSALLGSSLVVRPMQLLIGQARRVGAGDLSARVRPASRDEIGLLADEMNRMCDSLESARSRLEQETRARIAALEQLRHADRLATVGTLASGIAHELGTPLTVVSTRARMIEKGSTPAGDVPVNARIIREQAERMARIIRQLLDFSRRPGGPKQRQDLNDLAEQSLVLLRPLAEKRRIALCFAPAPCGEVATVMDAPQIRQVVTNLVMNSIQAMDPGGCASIRVDRVIARPPMDRDGPEEEYACMEVADEGPGIAAEHLPRIFDPFFTTKGIGEGTGLGLSVSYGIAREHGGWIGVESAPGSGSRFRLFLPLAESRRPALPDPSPRADRLEGRCTIECGPENAGLSNATKRTPP